MPKKLSRKNYESVLKFYKLPFQSNQPLKELRRTVEELMSDKLCRCIKKVTEQGHPDGEKRAIPVCKRSILHRKGLTDSGFSCKKKKSITLRKRGGKRTVTRKRSVR
jgi:hypothetical protein